VDTRTGSPVLPSRSGTPHSLGVSHISLTERARALPSLVSSRVISAFAAVTWGLFVASEGRTLVLVETNSEPVSSAGARVQVGIDAAITSNHHVCVRQMGADGAVVTSRFVVPPTLAGLSRLTTRLADYPGVVAVAEPTSMSWLPLAAALTEASGQLALIGSRHAARLRGAITGKNTSLM
jgi:hypothetical protein